MTVRGATARYASREVFTGFSSVFPSKSVTALVGPSGSGKSTLLAMIAGFRPPTSGTITLGKEGDSLIPSPSLISWIAQDANIITARSALDNVMIGPLADGLHVSDATRLALYALSQVGLAAHSYTLTRYLSGGERQRVAIARALASDKPLILADEPSAALDEASTKELARVFARVSGNSTIIVATHDPVMIAAASSVVALRLPAQ